MHFLESVFNSNKFELEDAVLSEYNIFFDENEKRYNQFSLDDEDIPDLNRFVSTLKDSDPDCKIYVLTYGYELTSSNGEKFTYADQLWIDTDLDISDVKKLVSISEMTEPSDIRYFCDCNEVEYSKIYLISRSENGVPVISEIEKENAGQIVTLYWD
ncbi:MAG: hypothetical protein J1F11_04315 [Oscillospiraceae bacterium]|nr:hypothetical protein [Oscillospiraceae bacterium]